MSRDFHNIETRPYPGHDYRTAYGRGKVWHIRRAARRSWRATSTVGGLTQVFGSLEEVSRWLDGFDA